jgi:hypothetical protein
MPIKITFDVDVEGRHVRGDFTWEGTRENLLNLMRSVEEAAAKDGLDLDHLVRVVYARLPTTGPREARNEFQYDVMVYGVVRYANKVAAVSEMPAILARRSGGGARHRRQGDNARQ